MAANETKIERAGVPYTSFRTLMNTVERMNDQGGAPSRVDRSYLANMPGGERGIFMTGLKSLGLVTEELEPTPDLHELVDATEEGRKAIIKRIAERVYEEPLSLPKRATQNQLETIFRTYGITGSTLRRAISFFLAATDFAGIERSPHFRIPPRERRKAKSQATTEAVEQLLRIEEPIAKVERVSLAGRHPLIEGLIRELPEPGKPFPQQKRDAWFEIAKATFQLIYPTEKSGHDSGTATETDFVTKQEDDSD
jgi:hypothetical protein